MTYGYFYISDFQFLHRGNCYVHNTLERAYMAWNMSYCMDDFIIFPKKTTLEMGGKI
mgnify:CR=1 FL=1